MMEKKMEATIPRLGIYWDNGKENGSYYSRAWDVCHSEHRSLISHSFVAGCGERRWGA